MNAGWFAVLGALAAGVPQLITAGVQWWTAKAERNHLTATKLREAHQEQISQWREGLSAGAAGYRAWQSMQKQPALQLLDDGPPNLVGHAWFQSLRPHLPARYEKQSNLRCDQELFVELADEINRIEKGWEN